MSIVKVGRTWVSADFDSGFYKSNFNVENKFLNSFWFNCNDEIWNSISSQIAVIVEVEIKKLMKDKMNKEAYDKEFVKQKANEEVKDGLD